MKQQTKSTLKGALKFALCMLPIALVAGIAVIFYQDEMGMLDSALAMADITKDQLIIIGIAQSTIYGAVAAFLGYILASKIGLLRSFSFVKKSTLTAVIAGAICGILFFTLDGLIFAGQIPGVATDYANYSFSITTIGAKVLYGGIIEEILMRWLLMSLVAFILWKISQLGKRSSSPKGERAAKVVSGLETSENAEATACNTALAPTWTLVVANILVAMLFAAGHLPATISLFGSLTAIILVRCFVLNGMFGLVFGWLYRNYGIQYAMVGHAMTHIVCMLSVFLFM